MEFIQMITDYGLDTLVVALCTVVATGLIKLPIKKLATKAKNSKKITRFITFLPIPIAFGLTVLSAFLITKSVQFNKDFYVQWISAVSLSLAIYAFIEKFVPSEKKILTEAEIEANKVLIAELKNKLVETNTASEAIAAAEQREESAVLTEAEQSVGHRKIILTNDKNA